MPDYIDKAKLDATGYVAGADEIVNSTARVDQAQAQADAREASRAANRAKRMQEYLDIVRKMPEAAAQIPRPVGVSAEEITKALAQIPGTAEAAAVATERFNQILEQVETTGTAAGATIEELSRAYKELYGTSTYSRGEIGRLNAELARAKEHRQAYQPIIGTLRDVVKWATATAATLAAIVGYAGKVWAAWSQSQAAMRGLLGSAEAARTSMTAVERIADQYGISLRELHQEMPALAAATRLAGADMETALELVAQLSRGLPMSVAQAASAVTNILADTTAQLPIELRAALDISTEDLKRWREAGVSGIEAVQYAMERARIPQMALAASRELTAEMNRLRNANEKAWKEFGEALDRVERRALPVLTRIIDKVADLIDKLDKIRRGEEKAPWWARLLGIGGRVVQQTMLPGLDILANLAGFTLDPADKAAAGTTRTPPRALPTPPPPTLAPSQIRELRIVALEAKLARAEQLEDMRKIAEVETQLIGLYRERKAATEAWMQRGAKDQEMLLDQYQALAESENKLADLAVKRMLREREAAKQAIEDARRQREEQIRAAEDATQAWLTFAEVMEGRGDIAAAERARAAAAAGFRRIAAERRAEPGAYWAAIARAEETERGVTEARKQRDQEAERERMERLREAVAGIADEGRVGWLELARSAAHRRDDMEGLIRAEGDLLAEYGRQQKAIEALAQTWGWLPEIVKAYQAVLDEADALTVSIADNTERLADSLKPILADWGDVISLLRQAAELYGGAWQEKYVTAMRARIRELGATPWETGEGGMPTAETMRRAQEYLSTQAALARALEALVEKERPEAEKEIDWLKWIGGQWAGQGAVAGRDYMRALQAMVLGAPRGLEGELARVRALERGQGPHTVLIINIDGKEAMRREISRHEHGERIRISQDARRL